MKMKTTILSILLLISAILTSSCAPSDYYSGYCMPRARLEVPEKLYNEYHESNPLMYSSLEHRLITFRDLAWTWDPDEENYFVSAHLYDDDDFYEVEAEWYDQHQDKAPKPAPPYVNCVMVKKPKWEKDGNTLNCHSGEFILY